jgi:hypothetical protein
VSLLSHALLVLASVFVSPFAGVMDTACQQVSSDADEVKRPCACALPAPQSEVPVFGIVQAPGGAPLRVLGRHAFKSGSESAKRVLLARLVSLVDQPQRDKLLEAHAPPGAQAFHPVSVSMWPTCGHVLRAPLTQLDRPPRV